MARKKKTEPSTATTTTVFDPPTDDPFDALRDSIRDDNSNGDSATADDAPTRRCRICGCTDDNACVDAAGERCHWIDHDVCSSCEDAVATVHDPGCPTGPEAIRDHQHRQDAKFADDHDLQPDDVVHDDGTIERAPVLELPDPPVRQFEEIAVDKIRRDERNRPSENLDALIPSVRERGVLQPILVRRIERDEHGCIYELVAGERRWHAAKTVGLEWIPAMVGDEDDVGSLVDQLVENLQREGLDPMYEARGYRTLLDELGCTQGELAAKLGVSQSNISKKCSLLELPKKAIQALDSGGISVSDAVQLARLTDHPDALAQVLAEWSDVGDWEHLDWPMAERIDEALERVQAEAAIDAELARLEAAGVEIIGPKSRKSYQRLNTYGGINLNEEKHLDEPCRAVVVADTHGGRTLHEACTKPNRHEPDGDSDLKVLKAPSTGTRTTRKKTDAEKRADAKERERRQQQREADEQRHAFMAAMLHSPPPESFWPVVARRALDRLYPIDCKAICEILGLNADDKGGPWRHRDALDRYIKKSATNLYTALYAYVLVQGDQRHEDRDHLRLLLDAGYEPHPAEKTAFKKASKK